MKTAMSIINQLCILFILPFITYVLKETHNLIHPPTTTIFSLAAPVPILSFLNPRRKNYLHLSCF